MIETSKTDCDLSQKWLMLDFLIATDSNDGSYKEGGF